MLSSVYQQSSIGDAGAVAQDPDNRLFGRMNRRRLEAEAIRDTLLVAAGRLDLTMGGPSVRDFGAPRRTLYITTIRSDRSGYGPLFDTADSTASVERRTVSTVAPQALFMLNSPFAMEQARAFADRLRHDAPAGGLLRIETAYRLLFGRKPTMTETRVGLDFVARAAKTGPPSAVIRERRAWDAYAQLLLCTNEFLFVD